MIRTHSLPILDCSDAPVAAISFAQRVGRTAIVVLLCGIGVFSWRLLGKNPWMPEHLPRPSNATLITLTVLLVLATMPAVHRPVFSILERLRHPTAVARRLTMLLIALLGGTYLIFTAFHQHRVMGPQWHDEHSYLIQMQMLARAHLWMPAHPMGDFFDSFHVLTGSVYASKYFPGASILFLPTIWFHLPYWVMPVTLSSLALAMTYRIITELIDGAAGLLAAVMLISLLKFRMLSTMTLSQVPLLLLALMMVWAWLHWRRNRSLPWAVAIGVFAGFSTLTRPLDTLCYVLPIGLSMLFDMAGLPIRRRLMTVLLVIMAAAPFLAVQLICDKGITGHWLRTPWEAYSLRSDPWDTVGRPKLDLSQPLSMLPQVVAFREEFSKPFMTMKYKESLLRSWEHWRLGLVINRLLPTTILLLFVPAALLGLCDRRRLAIAATLPLLILAYSYHTYFNEYYFIAAAPAALILVLLGMRQLEMIWPTLRPAIATMIAVAIITFCVAALPEVTGQTDEFWRHPIFPKVEANLMKIDLMPAVVLFRFDPTRRTTEYGLDAEPVYNIDVAWPDDAPVIRANDRGDDNRRIYAYYAEHQPQRAFYRYDEAAGTLEFLGLAKDLADRGEVEPPRRSRS